MNADKDIYLRVMEDRPFKLSAEEVDYRKSEGSERCGGCAHFYQRKIDGHTVCEVFRPEDDDNIIENYVCNFWNDDNEHYPLLGE
jgi:hypothetical protein